MRLLLEVEAHRVARGITMHGLGTIESRFGEEILERGGKTLGQPLEPRPDLILAVLVPSRGDIVDSSISSTQQARHVAAESIVREHERLRLGSRPARVRQELLTEP